MAIRRIFNVAWTLSLAVLASSIILPVAAAFFPPVGVPLLAQHQRALVSHDRRSEEQQQRSHNGHAAVVSRLIPTAMVRKQSMVTTTKAGRKNQPKAKSVGVVKQEWDWSLVLTYMTPWKNPNSIFVYLFLTLYLLGEYSEAHRTPLPSSGM